MTANEHTVLPPCQTCGIKPPLAHLLKAAIASASSRKSQIPAEAPSQPLLETHGQYTDGSKEYTEAPPMRSSSKVAVHCPRCTFENHPSLLSCEICGASLVSTDNVHDESGEMAPRTASPGPTTGSSKPPEEIQADYIKISFRIGGDKIFHERLKGAMIQRKWLLEHAPPVPQYSLPSNDASSGRGSGTSTPEPKGVGIAGLERLGLERQKNNQNVISSAFEDLEALMASAKEIIALAESFADKTADGSATKILNDSAAGMGMSMTKDMLDSAAGSDSLYLSELSRALAEYLTDDRQNVLKREGGVMSLVDLWAAFNRARNGVELVSPLDFEKAARMWEKLGLPVRLREFKNGLLVVQRYDWTDDKVIALLLGWLQQLHEEPPKEGVEWDQAAFGRGFTAQEAAAKFGWSVGVAVEELQMAEEKGVLCREEGIEGLKFWENYIGSDLLLGD
ncbi:MAG: hypothetical protein MMC23_000688 [Stictis urceolatum]|nr:hypothetical protein [Stictis urceolata]